MLAENLMPEIITIILDGLPEEVPPGLSVAQLVDIKNAHHMELIVELDGRFVHPRNYESTILRPGVRVELLLPAFGG